VPNLRESHEMDDVVEESHVGTKEVFLAYTRFPQFFLPRDQSPNNFVSQGFVHEKRIPNSKASIIFMSKNNIPIDQVKMFRVGFFPFQKETMELPHKIVTKRGRE